MKPLRLKKRAALVLMWSVLTVPGAWAQEQTGATADDPSEQTAKAEPAAADEAAELAKKLNNPIASLISVPLKYSWDTGIDPGDRDRSTYIVQPVIPFELNAEWNLITRTIVPYVDAEAPAGTSNASGTGDILQSFFFSPKAPTASGWIWGAGPVFSYPSASNDLLGSEKWSAGPTAILLKQVNGWTYGVLANHLWSFSGEDDRADVNATFLQPFLSFTTRKQTTWGVNSESTYDWEAEDATVPLNLQVSQLLRFGKQPISLALTYRHFLDTPEGGPDWGLSFTVTLLYPK
jgi:hypothetical protein